MSTNNSLNLEKVLIMKDDDDCPNVAFEYDYMGSNFLIDFYSLNAIELLMMKHDEYCSTASILYGCSPFDLGMGNPSELSEVDDGQSE